MKSPDLSQYLGVFLDEGQEQLDLLENHLLDMERVEPTTEVLQAMFRAAHTLKGSSRTMGFMRIGDLTHEMENALDELRNNLITLTTELTNALLESMDLLKEMMASVQECGNDSSFDNARVTALTTKLEAARTNAKGGSTPDAPSSQGSTEIAWTEATLGAAEAAQGAGARVREITISLRSDCILKSVRVHMIMSALNDVAEMIGCLPSEEDLEEERFELSFKLAVATEKSDDDILTAINTVSEIESVSLSDLCADAPVLDEAPEAIAVAVVPTANSPEIREPTKQAQSGTIRVSVSRLDSLLDLVGELVIDRSQIQRIAQALDDKYGNTELVAQLNETTHRIARITAELQDEIMKTRLLPIDGVFQRMPRMVRDVAQKINKKVDLQMVGGDTELDRGLLDVLSDPIIHLLRNSVDHGIESPEERLAAGKPETGKIVLSARHLENQICIEISDDGKGIDSTRLKAKALENGSLTQAQADAMTEADAIKLIFASGLSTAKEVSDISGRGVGMDIVRSNIEKIGGRIHIDSQVGVGTQIKVMLPLTLAILRALLVKAGTAVYALPLASVVETMKLGTTGKSATREKVTGKGVLVLRGETVPLANLLQVLQNNPEAAKYKSISKDANVVVIGSGEKKVGLCVDHLIGEQEIVIKPLGKLLGDIQGIAGASILGDGRVALIVDCAGAVNI